MALARMWYSAPPEAAGGGARQHKAVGAPELLAVWLLFHGAHMTKMPKTTTAAMAHIQAELIPLSRRSRLSRITSLLTSLPSNATDSGITRSFAAARE